MKQGIRPLLWSAIFAIFLSPGGLAQEGIRLIRADLLENEVIDGETVRKLSGDVVLEQGEVTLQSDRVAHYTLQALWIFEGNVRIIDPAKELRADYIRYDIAENRFYLRGNLRLERDGRQLFADRAVYYPDRNFYSCAGNVRYEKTTESIRADSADFLEPEETIDAYGRVRYRSDRDDVRLNGNYGRFISGQMYGMVTGNPSISFSDSAGTEITWIYGEIMEYFGEEKNVRIRNNVRINRGSLSATADTAWYYRETGNARLVGSPEIHDGDKTITAGEVLLGFQGNRIRSLDAEGDARATIAADTADSSGRANELRGSAITMEFAEDGVSRMTAQRNAICRYYVGDNGQNEGANVVSGTAITISFKDGAIETVVVEGGSEGKYFPPSLIDRIEAVDDGGGI